VKLRDPGSGITVEVITLSFTPDKRDGQWYLVRNRVGVCLPPGTSGLVRSIPELEIILAQNSTSLSVMEEL
jgi:hypothetical protein